MTPIEENHLTQRRELGVDPPQIVVVELFHRRCLERHDAHALRIDSLEHSSNGPVLSGRVDPLKDHEHRVFVPGVQQLLQLRESCGQLLELLAAVGFGAVEP